MKAYDKRDAALHPSYGMVAFLRHSGVADLFGVDYPQGHSMALRISAAEHIREDYGDRFFSRDLIIEVEMSETQFAGLICGIGTEGVPCTIRHQTIDGQRVTHPLPPVERKHNDMDYRKSEVAKRANAAVGDLDEAVEQLQAMMDAGALKKGDLAKALDKLKQSRRTMADSVPYIVDVSGELLDKASDRSRAEVEAYFNHAKIKLGERALAQAAALAVQNGEDPAAVLLDLRPEGQD